MYKYNICFIKQGTRILLINRNAAPLMGRWNGVGGKIEQGETVLQSVLREVYEETGIDLDTAIDKGVVSWEVDGIRIGGMHIFVAELPENFEFETPKLMDEGILAWKEIDWIMDQRNEGIVPHVSYYLKQLFDDQMRYEHQCVYKDDKLVDYQAIPLALVSV
jgi:8-oxo-dGTP diphosphatase